MKRLLLVLLILTTGCASVARLLPDTPDWQASAASSTATPASSGSRAAPTSAPRATPSSQAELARPALRTAAGELTMSPAFKDFCSVAKLVSQRPAYTLTKGDRPNYPKRHIEFMSNQLVQNWRGFEDDKEKTKRKFAQWVSTCMAKASLPNQSVHLKFLAKVDRYYTPGSQKGLTLVAANENHATVNQLLLNTYTVEAAWDRQLRAAGFDLAAIRDRDNFHHDHLMEIISVHQTMNNAVYIVVPMSDREAAPYLGKEFIVELKGEWAFLSYRPSAVGTIGLVYNWKSIILDGKTFAAYKRQ